MHKKITRTFLLSLLIVAMGAYQESYLRFNGQEIPIINTDESILEINLNLPDGISVASPEFHQKYVIPIQRRLKVCIKPILCFLTNNDAATLAIEGPVYYILIPKNGTTEGCLSSLFHELGHLWVHEIKNDTLKITNSNPGMINYALKMKDNFIGFGACCIASGLIFLTTSQYFPNIYFLPILYGSYRITSDIPKAQYYNYCQQLEEEVCDIFMAFVIAKNDITKNERIAYIDQSITSINKEWNPTLELKFFMFFTGKTHPSNQARIAQLVRLKDMAADQIKDLLERKLKVLMAHYKRFYFITGLS